jgi:hypothetical protein
MTHQTKRPHRAVAAAGRAKGRSRRISIHKNKTPDNAAIWDACREARDAEAERKQQAAARLEAAATRLGFAQTEDAQWERDCPHCRRRLALFASSNRGIHVRQFAVGLICPAIPSLTQWLRDEGFQS